jgi:hypothetical protein
MYYGSFVVVDDEDDDYDDVVGLGGVASQSRGGTWRLK